MKPLRIFLVNLGYTRPFYPLVTPPMGLLYLGAYLRERFDAEIRVVNQRVKNESPESLARQAADFGADIVGLSSFTTTAYLLPEMSRCMREALPEALLLLGGPHVSAAGADAMEGVDVDAGVPGEGEISFERIIHAWRDGEDFSSIPGLLWRNDAGEQVVNPGPVEVVQDLDSLPMPAYDLIDLESYWQRQSIAPFRPRKYASLVSSRGCPYRCMWCHKIFGKRIRMHSAERIVEEMAHLQKTYGIEDFEFLDDNFNFKADRVVRFADVLKSRNLKTRLAFPTAVRGDLVTEEVVEAMHSSGMYFCGFSLETGSPRLQEYTHKRLNIPKFLKGVEMVADRHVYITGFCMMGFPTETEEEL